MMIKLKVPIANGIIVDHSESRRPTPLTTKYMGIRPPPKNIVNTMRNIKTLFHITFLRDNT
ncbi:hypothetical protein D3C81_1018990 [compost metagenome]